MERHAAADGDRCLLGGLPTRRRPLLGLFVISTVARRDRLCRDRFVWRWWIGRKRQTPPRRSPRAEDRPRHEPANARPGGWPMAGGGGRDARQHRPVRSPWVAGGAGVWRRRGGARSDRLRRRVRRRSREAPPNWRPARLVGDRRRDRTGGRRGRHHRPRHAAGLRQAALRSSGSARPMRRRGCQSTKPRSNVWARRPRAPGATGAGEQTCSRAGEALAGGSRAQRPGRGLPRLALQPDLGTTRCKRRRARPAFRQEVSAGAGIEVAARRARRGDPRRQRGLRPARHRRRARQHGRAGFYRAAPLGRARSHLLRARRPQGRAADALLRAGDRSGLTAGQDRPGAGTDAAGRHGVGLGGGATRRAGRRRISKRCSSSCRWAWRWPIATGVCCSPTPRFTRAAGLRRTRRRRPTRPISSSRADKTAMSDAVRRYGQGPASSGDIAVRLKDQPDEPVSLSLAGVRGLGEAAVLLGLTDTSEETRLKRQVAQATKMQAVGQLAGGVAHDFNNVLTAILGTCDLMLLRHIRRATATTTTSSRSAPIRTAPLRSPASCSPSRASRRCGPKCCSCPMSSADVSQMLKRLIGERIQLVVTHDRDLGPVRADPQPARTGHRQPRGQCPRRHAGPQRRAGRQAADLTRRVTAADVRAMRSENPAAGGLYRARRARHRRRHSARAPGQDLRTLLHHQGPGSRRSHGGHGAWPFDCLWRASSNRAASSSPTA